MLDQRDLKDGNFSAEDSFHVTEPQFKVYKENCLKSPYIYHTLELAVLTVEVL